MQKRSHVSLLEYIDEKDPLFAWCGASYICSVKISNSSLWKNPWDRIVLDSFFIFRWAVLSWLKMCSLTVLILSQASITISKFSCSLQLYIKGKFLQLFTAPFERYFVFMTRDRHRCSNFPARFFDYFVTTIKDQLQITQSQPSWMPKLHMSRKLQKRPINPSDSTVLLLSGIRVQFW